MIYKLNHYLMNNLSKDINKIISNYLDYSQKQLYKCLSSNEYKSKQYMKKY